MVCNCSETCESVMERRPKSLSDSPASWSHFLGENPLLNESNVQNKRKDKQSMQNDPESNDSITSGGSLLLSLEDAPLSKDNDSIAS